LFTTLVQHRHVQGWPEAYIYTIYDRVYGDFPAIHHI